MDTPSQVRPMLSTTNSLFKSHNLYTFTVHAIILSFSYDMITQPQPTSLQLSYYIFHDYTMKKPKSIPLSLTARKTNSSGESSRNNSFVVVSISTLTISSTMTSQRRGWPVTAHNMFTLSYQIRLRLIKKQPANQTAVSVKNTSALLI